MRRGSRGSARGARAIIQRTPQPEAGCLRCGKEGTVSASLVDFRDDAIDALGTMTMMAASDAGLSLAAILAYGNPRYRSLKGKPNPKRRGSDIDLDLIWLLQLGQCILSCIIV